MDRLGAVDEFAEGQRKQILQFLPCPIVSDLAVAELGLGGGSGHLVLGF